VHAHVVPDRHRHAERSEPDQHGELFERRRSVDEERDPLRGRDRKRREREPVPALPHQHAGGRRERDEQDEHGAAVPGDAGENGRAKRTEDAERRDAARLPAERQRGRDHAHADREQHRQQLRNDLVHLRSHGDRDEQSGDARGDRGEGGVGARLRLMQPHAERKQPAGADRSEHDARCLSDPAVGHGEREQEDDAEQHGEPADPGEHATADEILEILAPEIELEDRRARRSRMPQGRRGSGCGLCRHWTWGRGGRRSGSDGGALGEGGLRVVRLRLGRRLSTEPLHGLSTGPLEEGDSHVQVGDEALQAVDSLLGLVHSSLHSC
jgi:hypothetical protein